MHQVECKLALRELIESNKEVLTEGLVHSGAVREIKHISLSKVDAPTEYYYILILVPSAESRSVDGSMNRGKASEYITYSCEIIIADAIYMQPAEPSPYERMTLDRDKVVDRLVALLRETSCLSAPYPDNAPKFKLLKGDPDRDVLVTNEDTTWEDEQNGLNGMAVMSRLEFSMEEYP